MTTSVARPSWFGPPNEPLLGWWELPDDSHACASVVLCPSLAQEHTSAYRSLRFLAESLAAAGFATLRFDYAGTGDSAGTGDEPDRVARWRQSVVAAVGHAREVVAAPVAVVGLRMGATLLAAAYSTCAPLAAVVLWDPCVSGKAWLRKQAVLHRLTSAAFVDGMTPLPAGSVEIAGVTFDPTSAAALNSCSLDHFGWTETADCPVLALTRAGSGEEGAVLPGVAGVEQRQVTGQEDLVDVEPVKAQVPQHTLQLITGWLTERVCGEPVDIRESFTDTATLIVEGTAVRERAARFGPRGVAGVVTEPAEQISKDTVVFLGASDHRVGPARLWVTWSRALAANGLRCMRLDVGGTGDGVRRPDELELHYYTEDAVADSVSAVRAVVGDGRRSTLVGLCAGAWTAMLAAEQLQSRSAYLISQLVWTRTPIRIRPSTELAAAAYDDDRRHRLRGRVRSALPSPVTMFLDEVGATNGPVARLAQLSRRGVDAIVVLGGDESDAFDKLVGPNLRRQLMPSAVMRRLLRRRGRPDVVRADGMDHAMLTHQGRARGTALMTGLIESAHLGDVQ